MEELAQACRLAERLVHSWDPLVRLYSGVLGAAPIKDGGLGRGLLLLHGDWDYCWFVSFIEKKEMNTHTTRLSPPVGSLFLFCHPSPSHLARCRRWWCRPGLDPLVGSRPPCSPPLYGHGQGSIFRAQGTALLTLWLDGYEAESQAHWADGHFRP